MILSRLGVRSLILRHIRNETLKIQPKRNGSHGLDTGLNHEHSTRCYKGSYCKVKSTGKNLPTCKMYKGITKVILLDAVYYMPILASGPFLFTLIVEDPGHSTGKKLYKVWSYRTPPPLPSKRAVYLAEGLGGICWWWILWHLWTEPEHIYGEWEYIHPSTWTDDELGIPPDSEGPLPKKC